MASEFFGKKRECRFYTAGCGNKMAVSVTGPRPVNELSGPVIPGSVTVVVRLFRGILGCINETSWSPVSDIHVHNFTYNSIIVQYYCIYLCI